MITRRDLICLSVGFVLGVLSCYLVLPRGDQQHLNPNMSNSTSGLQSTTSVQVVPKSDPGEEDLCLSQHYVANINNQKVSVPIVPKATINPNSQPNSSSGNTNDKGQVKAVVDQTIDLTPVLSQLRPTWELGIGYTYLDNKHYSCVSLQRNYKKNKALDLTCQIQDNKVKGFSVQHKWLLH